MAKKLMSSPTVAQCNQMASYFSTQEQQETAFRICMAGEFAHINAFGFVWVNQSGGEETIEHAEIANLNSAYNQVFTNGVPGTSTNPHTADFYNKLAKYDEWPGGYVENFGHVGAASACSNAYGCSMIHGSSLVSKGSSDAPLPISKFYELDHYNLWQGGYIEHYGNKPSTVHVLLNSGGQSLVTLGDGKSTIGSLLNLGKMIRAEEDQTLLENSFTAAGVNVGTDDAIDNYIMEDVVGWRPMITTAQSLKNSRHLLSEGYVFYARILEGNVSGNPDPHIAGHDCIIVDYNPVRHQYIYIDAVGNQIMTLSESALETGSKTLAIKIVQIPH